MVDADYIFAPSKTPSATGTSPRDLRSRQRRKTTSNMTAAKTLSRLAKGKSKQPKDAPKFEVKEIQGVVRFPPHISNDSSILTHLQTCDIFPSAERISHSPETIPYTSDKKGGLKPIGRSSFTVFKYRFTGPDGRPYYVLWDYEIGLVRITPFFKALEYQKTIPAKAIRATPGLMELCHSVTGGALYAQGYWMPYEAAKALAANFCHQIRYALVPLFGDNFPGLCKFSVEVSVDQFQIADDIVRECTREDRDRRMKASDMAMSRRARANTSHTDKSDEEYVPNNSSDSIHTSCIDHSLENESPKEQSMALSKLSNASGNVDASQHLHGHQMLEPASAHTSRSTDMGRHKTHQIDADELAAVEGLIKLGTRFIDFRS